MKTSQANEVETDVQTFVSRGIWSTAGEMLHLVLVLLVLAAAPTAGQSRVVCYYKSQAVERPGDGKFDVEDIDPSLCTHAIYGHIRLAKKGTVYSFNKLHDIKNEGFKRFNSLKSLNPNLTTLVSIGDIYELSTHLSSVCDDVATRAELVQSAYNFVKQHGFDGVDICWLYPGLSGGTANDKENLVTVLRDLKAKFAPDGLLVSTFVHGSVTNASTSYDIPEISKIVDFINLMTFDYHSVERPFVTAVSAPLYAASSDTDQNNNVNATVQYWLSHGAPAAKLHLGIALHGRFFTLRNANYAGPGAPSSVGVSPGSFMEKDNLLGYNEICEMQGKRVWNTTLQSQTKALFASRDKLWVSYDNTYSIRFKAFYTKEHGLGGIVAWSIDTDDFRDICGGGKFPLLRQIVAGPIGTSQDPTTAEFRPATVQAPATNEDPTHTTDPNTNEDSTHTMDSNANEDSTPTMDPNTNEDSTHTMESNANEDSTHTMDSNANEDSTHTMDSNANEDSTHTMDLNANEDSTPTMDSNANEDSTPTMDSNTNEDSTHTMDPINTGDSITNEESTNIDISTANES